MVYFDPYGECENESHQFDQLAFRVRPLLINQSRNPQLCATSQYEEAGDDFNDGLLFSFVAWDHVSWPGNDFYGGARFTDDGVKAAATDVMRLLTGHEGIYDRISNRYQPPQGYDNWGHVVSRNALRLRSKDNLIIT